MSYIHYLLALNLLFSTNQTFLSDKVNLANSEASYSPDGRLALSLRGNLWLLDGEKLTQLTYGKAEDRDPTWAPDGKTLVFASNRSGQFDLWQLSWKNGKVQLPVLFLETEEEDLQPHIGKDNTLVWVKGKGADANLWIKKSGKDAYRLTSGRGPEHSPSLSPDGTRVVYIAERKGRKELRLRYLNSRRDDLIDNSLSPEFPAWSPDGKRISFSSRGNTEGVWITTPKGTYKNFLSSKRAATAWTPDGKQLVMLPLDRRPPSYNGDPLEAIPRYLDPPLTANELISFLEVPVPPDTRETELDLAVKSDQAIFQERFDRVADYLGQRYPNEGSENADWLQMVAQSRKALASAKDAEAVEQIIYKLIKDRPPFRKEVRAKAGISSAHPLATAAGLEILQKGGNVVDAAIAVSFAIGVVEPDASGLGGYGEMLVFLKGMKAPTCIEFLTRVPEAASLTNGYLNPLPQNGPVVVNIPGTVAGMELAWQRYGSKKIRWPDLLEPAIQLADKGFILDQSFPTTLETEKENYLRYASARKLFFPDGKALQPGDTLRNPDLAWVLRQIAWKGGKGFYEGAVARMMVEDLRGKGNVMTLEDMARYYAVERKPVKTTYRGHTVYSGPPPVSGGASLIGQLNLLEQWKNPEPYQEDAATFHSMVEAWKLAPSGFGRVADPGLWPVDLSPFTDKEMAEKRWASCFNQNQVVLPEDSSCIDNRVSAAWGADGVLDAVKMTGTTAFTVADADGNMVAVTQTLGTWGGNFYVTPGLGFIYNDKLRSYSSNPKNYNARIPFARNVTSIAPTLVFKGTEKEQEPFLAVGAAGNAWITSAVYQIVSGVVDFGLSPQEAMEQPRFLVGVRRDPKNRKIIKEIVIQAEDAFAPGVLESLVEKGHEVQRISARGELRMGYASAVMIDGNLVRAGADPRRSGQAGGI